MAALSLSANHMHSGWHRRPGTVHAPGPAFLSRDTALTRTQHFDDRRDTAIVRLFLDTGMRSSELAGLLVTDIDLDQDVAVVLGKGSRPRACPFGDRTGQAIERYLRERSKHQLARNRALGLVLAAL
jgi:site-specific recombinase XerD